MAHWTEYLIDGKWLFSYSIDYWKRQQDRRKQLQKQMAELAFEMQELEKKFEKQVKAKGYTDKEIEQAKFDWAAANKPEVY